MVSRAGLEPATLCLKVLIADCDGSKPRALKRATGAGFGALGRPPIYLGSAASSWVIQPEIRHKPRHTGRPENVRYLFPVPLTIPPAPTLPPLPLRLQNTLAHGHHFQIGQWYDKAGAGSLVLSRYRAGLQGKGILTKITEWVYNGPIEASSHFHQRKGELKGGRPMK